VLERYIIPDILILRFAFNIHLFNSQTDNPQIIEDSPTTFHSWWTLPLRERGRLSLFPSKWDKEYVMSSCQSCNLVRRAYPEVRRQFLTLGRHVTPIAFTCLLPSMECQPSMERRPLSSMTITMVCQMNLSRSCLQRLSHE